MTMLERIKMLCREKKNISITTLEQELKYSNGSLAKAKDIPSSRVKEIAEFLEVSVDYLMTGKEPSESKYSTEMAHLVSQIRNDAELSKALLLYFELPENKKKHVVDTIKILSEV